MTEPNEISRRTFLSRGVATGGAVMLAGAAGTALAACSSNNSASSTTTASGSKPGVGTGTPVRGGTLTVGTVSEIDGFYPPSSHWDTTGYLYALAVFDPLCAVSASGSVEPYLCESIGPNSTFDTWTMTLRPNIKFNDGSDLTSAVIVSNYEALRASLLTGQALVQIDSVTATDSMTVVYKLQAPNPTFDAGLTTQVGYVFGQAMIDEIKANSSANPNPVGTGPFVYQQWEPNDHFTATRNPHYWRSGLPYLDAITFKPIPDTAQREATLKSGGVDLIESTDPGTIVNFQGQSEYQLVDSRTGIIGEPTMAFIILNTIVAPTDDLRIRQALAKATDQATVQRIYGAGFAKPVNGLFLQDSEYYSETAFPAYDLAGAKQLVNAYKAEHGTPTLKISTITDPKIIQIVEVLQQMWQEAGFVVTIAEIEQATLIDDFITGEFQAATLYQFGAIDPDLNYVWWSTTTVGPVGSIALNFARNKDPIIEQAMLTGRHTTDTATRVQAYQSVNKRLAEDLPYIWLEQYLFSEVATNQVQNFNNPTLPSGAPQYAFDEGIFVPLQTWLAQ